MLRMLSRPTVQMVACLPRCGLLGLLLWSSLAHCAWEKVDAQLRANAVQKTTPPVGSLELSPGEEDCQISTVDGSSLTRPHFVEKYKGKQAVRVTGLMSNWPALQVRLVPCET